MRGRFVGQAVRLVVGEPVQGVNPRSRRLIPREVRLETFTAVMCLSPTAFQNTSQRCWFARCLKPGPLRMPFTTDVLSMITVRSPTVARTKAVTAASSASGTVCFQ